MTRSGGKKRKTGLTNLPAITLRGSKTFPGAKTYHGYDWYEAQTPKMRKRFIKSQMKHVKGSNRTVEGAHFPNGAYVEGTLVSFDYRCQIPWIAFGHRRGGF